MDVTKFTDIVEFTLKFVVCLLFSASALCNKKKQQDEAILFPLGSLQLTSGNKNGL